MGEDELLQSLFQFGNIFSFSVTVRQSSCNCAPIPKMVPHSLNEQKCIGESVRMRALVRVEVNSSRPLSPLQGDVALHSGRHEADRAHPCISRLRSVVDQVLGSTTMSMLGCLQLILNNNNKKKTTQRPLDVHMAEAHLQTPPVLCGNKKKTNKTKRKGKKKHPQISMWFVNNQSSSME